MQSEWKRSTRECSFAQLRPELTAAIRDAMQRHELTGWEENVLFCCETTSERDRVGLLSRLLGSTARVVYSAALVTPRWMIYASTDPKTGAFALAMQVANAEISHEVATTMQDHGPNFLSFRIGAAHRESLFIGLGAGSAAERFETVLREAVAQAS